jgi:hypothetical protein
MRGERPDEDYSSGSRTITNTLPEVRSDFDSHRPDSVTQAVRSRLLKMIMENEQKRLKEVSKLSVPR